MRRSFVSATLVCGAAAAMLPAPVRADFTYTETTQMTGGSMIAMMKMAGTFSKAARQIGEPTATTVIVKGNRMTRITPDHTEIIDLDKGTITQIDICEASVHGDDLRAVEAADG